LALALASARAVGLRRVGAFLDDARPARHLSSAFARAAQPGLRSIIERVNNPKQQR